MITVLERALTRGVDCGSLVDKFHQRVRCASDFISSYRRYCWTVSSLSDLKLAPFHVLASEGSVHTDKSHLWHMELAPKLATAAPNLVMATKFMTVERFVRNEPLYRVHECVFAVLALESEPVDPRL